MLICSVYFRIERNLVYLMTDHKLIHSSPTSTITFHLHRNMFCRCRHHHRNYSTQYYHHHNLHRHCNLVVQVLGNEFFLCVCMRIKCVSYSELIVHCANSNFSFIPLAYFCDAFFLSLIMVWIWNKRKKFNSAVAVANIICV